MDIINDLDVSNKIKNEILKICKNNRKSMSKVLVKWIKKYSDTHKDFLTKIIINKNFDNKLLHFAKLALLNGCYFDNFESLNIFMYGLTGCSGFDDTLYGDFRMTPINDNLISFLEYANEINYKIDKDIDLSTALCWTGQFDLLKRIHNINIDMNNNMLFPCIAGLCFEENKKYDERLNIIKWAIENKLCKFEKYINYTNYESISSIIYYDNTLAEAFILDKDDKFIDGLNVEEFDYPRLISSIKEDKINDLISEYTIKYAK